MPDDPYPTLEKIVSEPRPGGFRELIKNSQALVQLVFALRKIPADVRTFRWKRRRPGVIRRYLADHETRKMQIGTGYNPLEGWLNTDVGPRSPDVIYLDGAQPFPFEDKTFDCIFSEHVIEHLFYKDGYRMLSECFRVLVPGGRLRVATPNLTKIAQLAVDRENEDNKEYIRLTVDKHIADLKIYEPAFVINNFYWDYGHYFNYDPETMRLTLESIGYEEVREYRPGESDDPNLSGIETHGEIVGDFMNDFETMVFEGRRPD